MCKYEIWLIIVVALNLGLSMGFGVRCWYDKDFRNLANQMYKMIK